ncbi:hypothetical protein Tco_1421910 [Tanacetum coccineum]
MIFKVDFEKAFDTLNWNFLDDIMRQMGFGKGVRQGDPLSPFLFLIMAEALSVAIKEATEGASGLKVNLSKLALYGVGVVRNKVDCMASTLKCTLVSLPFNYLGLSVRANMSIRCNWSPIIEKVQKRFSLLQAWCLSIGGRLTLVKSVLGSLPLYYFSIFCAPSKVLILLESIRGRVFFGGSAEDQKISWVAWKQSMVDRSMRGLGIGSLSASNLGLLATCGLDHKALIRFIQDLSRSDPANLRNELIPKKVNVFFWRLIRNCLPTKTNLVDKARSHDLLKLSGSVVLASVFTKTFDAVIRITSWVIWKHRNEKIFKNKDVSTNVMLTEIKAISHLWIHSRSRGNIPSWNDWVLNLWCRISLS